MTTSYNITKRRQSCSFVQWVFGDTWRRMAIGFALFCAFILDFKLISNYFKLRNMRCKNCGWPNKPNEKICVKCHVPLEADNEEVYNESRRSNSFDSEQRLNKTVMEQEVFGGTSYKRQEDDKLSHSEETSQCPKCGYPVRPGTEKCPNCKFSIKSSGESSHFETRYNGSTSGGCEEATRRPTRMNSGNGGEGKFRGTINPYMMNMEMEPTFVLKPLKRVNERHGFEEQEYEGKEVILNRDNTEQNNSSITSRQQAIVTRGDGHWYIEDRSEQKTTFVQAAQKVELHDGDIILLGNRLFEFHE